MDKESIGIWKLGLFVVFGLILFVIAIYFIGINRNLFGSTFSLKSEFKNISGLKVGSNVRLSGINIGTVHKIDFISDSLVSVKLLIKKEAQQYIKTDATASIGSDGLVGDKVLIISPGVNSKQVVKDNDIIASNKTIELEDIMNSVNRSAANAEVITKQLSDFSYKMNDKKGILSKVMTNQDFANSIQNTIVNLESSVREIALFSPKLNDNNGAISKIFNDKEFANRLESTIENLQKSSNELSVFTANMNNEHNMLTKLMTDKEFANRFEMTFKNLETSSDQLARFTSKINNKNSVLSKLIDDERLGESIDSTITNLESGAKGLNELEAAAQNNILLKGYFEKKKKAEMKNKKVNIKK
jgi:phospholipid/cholesterol/gamma-HCH transport system substrate-binding protein